jgi:hypothetical protein
MQKCGRGKKWSGHLFNTLTPSTNEQTFLHPALSPFLHPALSPFCLNYCWTENSWKRKSHLCRVTVNHDIFISEVIGAEPYPMTTLKDRSSLRMTPQKKEMSDTIRKLHECVFEWKYHRSSAFPRPRKARLVPFPAKKSTSVIFYTRILVW